MVFLRPAKRFLGFLSVAVALLSACHGRPADIDEIKSDSIPEWTDVPTDSLMLYEDEPEPETADMLFADFFYAFTTDERYQMQRVAFPLRGKDNREEVMTKDDFQSRAAFMPQEFYATIYDRESDMGIQNDTTVKVVAVERIHLREQTLEQYRFERLQGKWMLATCDTKNVAETPQSSFLAFYGQFANDTLFQRASIVFPLRLVSEGDEDEEGSGEAELTEEEWPEFRDQMPLPVDVMTAIDYGQAALSENRKILLMEGASNGLFVKYKFDRTDGQWKLYEIDF